MPTFGLAADVFWLFQTLGLAIIGCFSGPNILFATVMQFAAEDDTLGIRTLAYVRASSA